MKLHDLRPAAGSRRERTRVGRGIAAGKGKTAGRGTKGQKARAGASIPAWFEGGQTPIHIRVPKLRGFKNRFKIEYQVVNVGSISEYAVAGRFGVEGGAKSDVPTINAEALESAGLIGSAERPVKVLGHGDVSGKLFVAADAFSASARSKIEAAGGFVQVLAPELPAKAEPDAQPEAQPDVDASEAPEQEGSATSEVTAEHESTAEAEGAATEDSAAEAKPARRRTSRTTSEE
jgi:large subunit ribosomal protein L15